MSATTTMKLKLQQGCGCPNVLPGCWCCSCYYDERENRGTAGEKMQQHDDLTAFRRLRNYYRLRFPNGASDECFLNWVDLMCERERELHHASRTSGGR